MFARAPGSVPTGGHVHFGRLVAVADGCFTDAVEFYAIASSLSHDIDDFYATLEEAETALAQIFSDEPDFEGALWVERIELEFSLN